MKSIYPPKEFGLLINRATKTLQKWDRDGILKAYRSPTNRRYYTHDQYLQVIGCKAKQKKLIIYCRVSSAGQKKDLIFQRKSVEFFCLAAGKTIDETLEDVGSGLNYKRKNFLR
jgi:putative resolvase